MNAEELYFAVNWAEDRGKRATAKQIRDFFSTMTPEDVAEFEELSDGYGMPVASCIAENYGAAVFADVAPLLGARLLNTAENSTHPLWFIKKARDVFDLIDRFYGRRFDLIHAVDDLVEYRNLMTYLAVREPWTLVDLLLRFRVRRDEFDYGVLRATLPDECVGAFDAVLGNIAAIGLGQKPRSLTR